MRRSNMIMGIMIVLMGIVAVSVLVYFALIIAKEDTRDE